MMGLGLCGSDYDVVLLGVIKILNGITWFLHYVGIGVVDEYVAEEEYIYIPQPYAAAAMDSDAVPADYDVGIITKVASVGDIEEVTCSVCLSDFERQDEIWKLKNCCHIFHRGCLDKWIGLRHLTCPLCRIPLVPLGIDK